MLLGELYSISLASLPLGNNERANDHRQAKTPKSTNANHQPISSDRLAALKLPANAWDDFYTAHGEKFFKDRHYLDAEHASLAERLANSERTVRILDLGCGVGNSILPLLDTAQARVEYLGVDVSPRAVEILAEKFEAYASRHLSVLRALDVVNCTEQQWEDVLHAFFKTTKSSDGFDFCLMIFSASAFPPEKMLHSVQRACIALRPGSGLVCFRDYLRGDLAEERFPMGQKLGRGLFVRQDGTLSFFFTIAGLVSLFEDCGCMKVQWARQVIRTVENRAFDLKMNRSWIGAEFLRLS